MNVPEEDKVQLAKRQAIQEVMRDSSLSAAEKQRRVQELMSSNTTNGSAVATTMTPPSAGTETTPTTTTKQALMQEVMKDTSLTPQEKQKKIQEILKSAPAAAGSEDSAMMDAKPPAVTSVAPPSSAAAGRGASSRSVGASAARGDDPATLKVRSSNRVSSSTMPPAGNGKATAKPGPARAAGAATPTDAASSQSPNSPSKQKPGASAAPRSLDLGGFKASRGSNQRASAAAAAAAAAAATTAASPSRVKAAQDPAARKGMRSSTRRQSGARHGTALSGDGNEPVAIGDAETMIPPVSDQMPAPAFNDVEPAGFHPAVSSPAMHRSSMDEEYYHSPMPSPPQQQPEQVPEQTYAGLNYSGDVAIGGIAAYIAPEQTEQEAIDALGVVTESQLEKEDSRKRRKLLMCGLGVFVLLLIAIIVPVVVTQTGTAKVVVERTEAPSQAPSSSPTSSALAELWTAVEELYGVEYSDLFSEAFIDPDSPQHKAVLWAADTVPEGLAGNDPRVISRYALAALYFSTNGDDWVVCGRGSANCAVANAWLTAENECDWYAVECSDPANGDYSVVQLSFPPFQGPNGRNIGGTLPLDVSFLSTLRFFVLTRESVGGPFPDWSRLTTLENVLVNSNNLNGSFPAFLISQNPLLGTLHIDRNSFQGVLPPFSESTSLSDLRLYDNDFTGPIVPEIANLKSLSTLYMEGNSFTGSIPDKLYTMTSLTRLHLSNNTGLVGSLSSNMGKLSNMVAFRASNTSLGGPLPQSLFLLTMLQDLDLFVNSFDGPLSNSFSNLTDIESLRLYSNSFSGTIPAGLAQPSFLNTLELHDNDLGGTVPAALCARRGEGWSDLKVITVDADEVSCSCCTQPGGTS